MENIIINRVTIPKPTDKSYHERHTRHYALSVPPMKCSCQKVKPDLDQAFEPS